MDGFLAVMLILTIWGGFELHLAIERGGDE